MATLETPESAAPVAAPGPAAPGGQPGTPEAPADHSELRDARREAQGLRRRVHDLETAQEERTRLEQEAQGRHKELADRYKADLDQARATLRERDLRDAVTATARELGFSAPDAAHELIRPDAVQYTDGAPTNVAALLNGLATRFPGLLTPPAPAVPPAPPAPPVSAGAPAQPAHSATIIAPTFDPKNPPRLGQPGLFSS